MLLPLQGVNTMAIRNPGCRFACPGLGAFGLSARAYMPVALQRYALTMNKCLDTNEKNARQSKKIIER